MECSVVLKMTPKNNASRAFRDAVPELAGDYEFARPFINSGRLYHASTYRGGSLSTPDRDDWANGPAPGRTCLDALADLGGGGRWLLSALGDDFKLLHFGAAAPDTDLETIALPAAGPAAERYDAEEGASYLVRPDQVVAARWKNASPADIAAAYQKATGR